MSTQISYGDAQNNLDQLCDRVVNAGEAVIITRPNGKNVALVSESDLSGLLETLYLLRSPANATRLRAALERSQTGMVQSESIDELYRRFGLEQDDAENEVASAS